MNGVVNVGKKAGDVRASKLLMPYSKVVIVIDTEHEVSAGDNSGLVLTIENPWGTQEMAENILNKIRGYQYQPYTAKNAIVEPAAELGDAVQANAVYGGLFQIDSMFGSTFYSNFSAPIDEQLDHEYTFEDNTTRTVKRSERRTQATLTLHAQWIEARVTKIGGEEESFAWKLEENEFGLYSNNKKVFKCDKYGITVDGEIKARSGYIGTDANGFVIESKNIRNGMTSYSDTAHNGVYLGTDGIGLGAGNFYVTSAGKLVAKSGEIGSSGTASQRWNIGSRSIYNGTNSLSSTATGAYLGTDGIRVYRAETGTGMTFNASNGNFSLLGGMTSIGDTSHNGTYFGNDGIAIGGGKFKVTSAGEGTFRGTIYAKEGHIGATWNSGGWWNSDGFTIKTSKLYNGTDSVSSTTGGVYIGTDGIRLYNDASHYFTFQKNGTLSVSCGMTSINDTTSTGMFIGNDGIVLGGGKFKAQKDGSLTASNATLSGGYIGNGTSGFEIGATYIKNGKGSYDDGNNGVYIGTGGIGLGAGTFYVTSGGALTASNANITGTINANVGSIAKGFTITDNKIYNNGKSEYNSSTSGVYIGTDGIGLGPGYFYVTSGGALTAKSADISGTITSSSGTIGGFTLGNNYLGCNSSSYQDVSADGGVYIGTNGISFGRVATGDPNNPYKCAFRVSNNGKVTSQGELNVHGSAKIDGNTTIGGNVTISGSGTINGSLSIGGSVTIDGQRINAASISGTSIASGTVTGSNIAVSTVTGSNIAGSTVTGSNIANGTVSYNNTTSGVQGSLNNGDNANANLNSLVAGTLKATALSADTMYTYDRNTKYYIKREALITFVTGVNFDAKTVTTTSLRVLTGTTV